jgi:hypothetical protein
MKNEEQKLIEPQTEALNICHVISRLERRRDKINKEIYDKKTELKRICKHFDTEKKEEYIEGSYYDRAEYITKKVCKICGTELSKSSTSGGYG